MKPKKIKLNKIKISILNDQKLLQIQGGDLEIQQFRGGNNRSANDDC